MIKYRVLILSMILTFGGCRPGKSPESRQPGKKTEAEEVEINKPDSLFFTVEQDISIGEYFDFMDSLVPRYDSLLPAPYGEHLIVRANPRLIDTLENTDYYRLKERGVFNYDQKSLVVLHEGDSLLIPDSVMVDSLLDRMLNTVLDLNIPEFTLRILEYGEEQFAFPVRVGRNERKYLAMAGRVVDLRTQTGIGEIVRIDRNPTYINPSNNRPYYQTRRDDGEVTLLPRIPWLEPEVNGERLGHLIHPTTNPETLGRAYSNGCIGTREADAWRIYYQAPLGTTIVIRYDLEVVDEAGDTVRLKNIYPGFEKRPKVIQPAFRGMTLWPARMAVPGSVCGPECFGEKGAF